MFARYLTEIAIFCAPILILLILVEMGLRKIPNDYSYKHLRLSQSGADIQVLVLGNSHGYKGIDPEEFGQTGFNAANISQDLSYDRAILERYVVDLPNLKFLILPISYGSLGGSMVEGRESWRVKNYNLYMGIDKDVDDLGDRLELLNRPMDDQVHMLWRYYAEGKDNVSCEKSGVASVIRRIDPDLAESGRSAAARHYHPSAERTAKGINDLNEIVSLASSRGIQVILVTTPTWSTYRERLDNSQLAAITRTCEQLATNYSTVHYLDLLDDPRFGKSDFEDADHLSVSGSKKLSSILGDRLSSLGPVNPRSGGIDPHKEVHH